MPATGVLPESIRLSAPLLSEIRGVMVMMIVRRSWDRIRLNCPWKVMGAAVIDALGSYSNRFESISL